MKSIYNENQVIEQAVSGNQKALETLLCSVQDIIQSGSFSSVLLGKETNL